jgi:hypothetical protein
MNCKTCSHPQLHTIDLALLNKSRTLESLSHMFGLSVSSLFRHKKHLVEKMQQARQRLRDSQAQGCLLKLNAILDHVQRAVETAATDGKIDSLFRGAHVGSRIIHHINKMAVPLELDTVYRLISSPQWVAQDSLFPTDPQLIADIHQAVLDEALLPCPEPEPERLDAQDEDNDEYARVAENDDDDDVCDAAYDDDEYDDAAEDWDAEAEADAPDLADEYDADEKDSEPIRPAANCQSEDVPKLDTRFRQLLARLDLAVDSNRKIIPQFQREKSAKLPKNLFLSENYKEQYHTASLSKKILAQNLLLPPFPSQRMGNLTQNPELETAITLSPILPCVTSIHFETRNPKRPFSLIPPPFSLIFPSFPLIFHSFYLPPCPGAVIPSGHGHEPRLRRFPGPHL